MSQCRGAGATVVVDRSGDAVPTVRSATPASARRSMVRRVGDVAFVPVSTVRASDSPAAGADHAVLERRLTDLAETEERPTPLAVQRSQFVKFLI